MNIRVYYIVLFLSVVVLLSCKKSNTTLVESNSIETENSSSEGLEDIPIITSDIGKFPFYILPPENYHFEGSIAEMNFDEIYHFYKDSSTLSIGGKYYESPIVRNEDKRNKKKNQIYEDSLIIAHFDKQIKDLGGAETQLTKKYIQTLHTDQEIDSVRRYIIRTKKGNIWIDLISLRIPRQINYSVIFEGRMKQPVNIIKAERLRYALENNGKVVVYVNFAEGKMSLQPDGVKAVEEINKLMRIDPELRLSIEGHTDDVGTAEYCRRLSNERILTIVNFLKNAGIKTYRLNTVAYGSEHMVADNSTNESRAKNRRIELIKTNVDETILRNAIDQDGKAVLQITFESGKYILKPEGLDIVDQIAKLLTTDQKLKLSIEGHTDNVGSAQTNKQLSLYRANAVIDRLVELGIDRRRLKAAGYGSEKPIVPNTTEGNRGKNRRVEIIKI